MLADMPRSWRDLTSSPARVVALTVGITFGLWALNRWEGSGPPWPAIDLILSLAGCVALGWRRRFLPLVFVVLVVTAPWAASAIAAQVVVIYAVGMRRIPLAAVGAVVTMSVAVSAGPLALGWIDTGGALAQLPYQVILFATVAAAGVSAHSADGRSLRDRVVDAGAVLAVGLTNVLVLSAAAESGAIGDAADIVMVATAGLTVALWWRRRWPIPLALAGLAMAPLNQIAIGAYLLAVFTVAVYHRPRVVLPIGAGYVAGTVVLAVSVPAVDVGPVVVAAGAAVLYAAAIGWGMLVRSRHQLLDSLRERARAAEAQTQLRTEQARRAERERIAREMHDVLAHRLSLLSVHAGAMEYRSDAAPAEIAAAAGVVRENAHRALEDLAAVIGVLRADTEEAQHPQPTLADLDQLIDQARAAGTPVDLVRSGEQDEVPERLGRTAYRVVQEALTNARKHGAGSAARVTLAARAGQFLEVTVTNHAPVRQVTSTVPGTGLGLVGLAERVGLEGGELTHRVDEAGDFVVRARLPWPQ